MRHAPGESSTWTEINPDDRRPDAPEGPEMRFPGAREDELPERLGERVEDGPGEGIATGETDVLPDVEIPESTM